MWQRYRKTMFWTQLTILVGCAVMIFKLQSPVLAVLLFFVTTQLGAIAGAAWSARLTRKMQPVPQRLPLSGRV